MRLIGTVRAHGFLDGLEVVSSCQRTLVGSEKRLFGVENGLGVAVKTLT